MIKVTMSDGKETFFRLETSNPHDPYPMSKKEGGTWVSMTVSLATFYRAIEHYLQTGGKLESVPDEN